MNTLKILIVEDDEWDIDLLKYSLKQRSIPYELEIYNHGVAAARTFEHIKEIPDIIILDLNLPGIAGNELLKIVKTNERLNKVPVLILTTGGNSKYEELTLREGASRFMSKVVDVKDMNSVIDDILALTKFSVG